MRRSLGGTRGITTVLLLVLALVAAACSSGDDEGATGSSGSADDTTGTDQPSEPVPGGVATIVRHSENDSWDPTFGQWQGSTYVVANAIYDPLVAFDENDDPQPYLAESIESNDDFTEWTITMRPGVTFHNGEPADADAVVANLEAHRASALTGLVISPIATIDKVDDLTVRVTMSDPWSTFPRGLAGQIGYLVAPSTIGTSAADTNPVGTGPFVFDSWVRDGTLSVSKNPGYWQEGYPLLDGIDFPVITESSSRSNALSSGDADIIPLGTDSLPELEKFEDDAAAGSVIIAVDDEGDVSESHILLNTQAPPFDDPLAREILAYGLDTGLASEVGYEGYAPAARGMYSESSPWYVETDYPDPDFDKAVELTAEYEAKYGEPLAFDVLVPPGNDIAAIAQLLNERAREFGVEITIVPQEATAHITQTLTGAFQASAFAMPFTGHPDSNYIFLHSKFVAPPGAIGLNGTGIVNEQIDEALDAARTTDDPDEQFEQYKVLQEELVADMARIWIVHNIAAVVADESVGDLTNWTFPDGTQGKTQSGTEIRVHQLWLDQ